MFGRNLKNLVIVGTGKRALKYAKDILTKPKLGYLLTGFVDTRWYSDKSEIEPEIVSDFDSFSKYLRDNVIDEVLIAIPIKSYYETVSNLIATCEEQGIIVRVCTNFFNHKIVPQIEYIGKNQTLNIYTNSMVKKRYFIKEIFDFISSAILLVMLSPVFLLVALTIKISSKGPVFFIQERLGINKRLFKLYKFRTMIPDAEAKIDDLKHLNEMQGATFKIKNDPRITFIGNFLRKTSMDELPQLLNVIKGDISLVGPRPLPNRDYKGFKKNWQCRRFSVKPGITCTWQISGRNNITFDKWMEMDLEYIDKWNLLTDFKILLKTIPVALMGKGAC
jgi:exopolysaccharide biosynthesis polyprenyl glycosylphosphotransferase